MTHFRIFATTLFALAAFTATSAFAQTATSTSEASVTTVNTLTVESGGTVALSPTLAIDAIAAAPTVLNFETNDGATYNIVLSVDEPTAGQGWTFVPTRALTEPNAYPRLFVNAVTTTNAGSGSSTLEGDLISVLNAPSPINVVSGIINVQGTASVTLGSSITEAVVAGVYSADLTYTWTEQ